MNPIKYSIIIPTFNKIELLKRCLETVLKYTDWTDKELIIVSNGCKDGTIEYISELQTQNTFIKTLIYKFPLGYSGACNKGILKSRGEYIILLNNDAYIEYSAIDCWINKLTNAFLLDVQCGITGPLRSWGPEYLSEGLVFFCVCIKREVFNRIGLLDIQFGWGAGEDTFFCFKTKMYGYSMQDAGYYAWHFNSDEPKNSNNTPISHIQEGSTFNSTKEIDPTKVRLENGKTLEYKIKNAYNRSISIFVECEINESILLSLLNSSCKSQIKYIILRNSNVDYSYLDERIINSSEDISKFELDLYLTLKEPLFFDYFCLETLLRNITHEYYISSGVIDPENRLKEQTFQINTRLCLIDYKLHIEYPEFNWNNIINGPKYILDPTAKTYSNKNV